ncbi:hypothetical protein [Streptomyces sp. DH8]|uniref:hypothetical protein n=1 Tax=Streptomyces sp. DH8 TaxID=2857008 RepID=UPI001E3F38E0|nr:hypothetical protein [Streptomyces sp. DH8]
MNARDNLLTGISFNDAANTGSTPEELVDAYRAEIMTEFVTWLVKKAREHRAQGPQYTKQADVIGRLADQASRGAVRPNNLLMLPPQGGPEDVPALRARVAELETRPSPAEALRQVADQWAAHCPEHSDADDVWMDCPEDWVFELRRAADAATTEAPRG